jgi:hypothetical protein
MAGAACRWPGMNIPCLPPATTSYQLTDNRLPMPSLYFIEEYLTIDSIKLKYMLVPKKIYEEQSATDNYQKILSRSVTSSK